MTIVFLMMTTWPVLAAIELTYFRASASLNTVLLEWGTASETNIQGFIIECKRADEPESAYHAIGARSAVGTPDRGAAYSFNVAGGLEPGVSYCFRLVEQTIDGVPGDQFEICGYGAAITPTPALTPGVDRFGAVTPSTVIVVPAPNGLDELPMPTPDPALLFPTSTPTPFAPFSPQSGPEQPFSPLPDPDFDPDSDPDAESAGMFQNTPDPFAPDPSGLESDWDENEGDDNLWDSEGPFMAPTSVWTPEQPFSPPMPPIETPTPEAEAFLPGVGGGDEPTDATPTPPYLVVTATPTVEALVAAPTFTPWPTVTPEPEFDLMALVNPSGQNLMIMLLCLIFLTASGLGTLGLVTSVIYMRSRAQREEHLARLYGRRRF